jgi:hypothetical protein
MRLGRVIPAKPKKREAGLVLAAKLLNWQAEFVPPCRRVW